MEEIGARIKTIITELKMKQQDFAQDLNLSQPFVSQMISGSAKPSERTIADICQKFHVNKNWLLTGTGKMFVEKSVEQELGELLADMLNDKSSFKSQMIRALAAIPPDEWPKIERFIDRLTAMRESENQELISSNKKD